MQTALIRHPFTAVCIQNAAKEESVQRGAEGGVGV